MKPLLTLENILKEMPIDDLRKEINSFKPAIEFLTHVKFWSKKFGSDKKSLKHYIYHTVPKNNIEAIFIEALKIINNL